MLGWMSPQHFYAQRADGAQEDMPPAPDNMSSSSRMMRNLAEKNRRDKLNTYIQELATLVPSVALSPKRLDKTSILRHSAAYLRLHKMIKPGDQALAVPQIDSVNVMQMVLEDINGILFVVTSAGKIVFVSESVERILGHSQSDLLGQSIYGMVNEQDHDELKRNLTPDEDPNAITDRLLAGSDESSSDDTGTSASASVSSVSAQNSPAGTDLGQASPSASAPPAVQVAPPPEPPPIHQKRMFFMRLRQRAVSRGDNAQYELVQAHGHLRIPGRPATSSASTGHRRKSHDSSSSNDIVLVTVVQLFREPRISEDSLLESTKDEYLTRHTMDGRIIYCDHRISLVAGYLSEEVAGLSAFKYMHKDDVRWTMVALRQMLSRGEDYGSSCYRLKAKTGDFIYLKTYGYLEKDKVTQSLNSFICINVLVSEQEGEEAIREMHKRYSPHILPEEKPRKSGVIIKELPNDAEESTEKEETLEPLINQLLLSKLPDPPPPSPGGSTPAPNEHYVKATIMSKSLPPASIHTAKVGIRDVPKMISGSSVPLSPRQPMSPPTSLTRPPQWSPQGSGSTTCEDWGRPSVVQAVGSVSPSERVRSSIISGLKRSHEGVQREDDPKRYARARRPRLDSDPDASIPQAPLTVDVNATLPLRGASPANSPLGRGSYPMGPVVKSSVPVGFDTVQSSRTELLSDPQYVSSNTVPVFTALPNGNWGRSGPIDQAGPALLNKDQGLMAPDLNQELSNSYLEIFASRGMDPLESYALEEESGLGMNGTQLQQQQQLQLEAQGEHPVQQQLILRHMQLNSDLTVQQQQMTEMAEGLQQVPHDNPEGRSIASTLVELKVEHSRQEKILQELTRETLGV